MQLPRPKKGSRHSFDPSPSREGGALLCLEVLCDLTPRAFHPSPILQAVGCRWALIWPDPSCSVPPPTSPGPRIPVFRPQGPSVGCVLKAGLPSRTRPSTAGKGVSPRAPGPCRFLTRPVTAGESLHLSEKWGKCYVRCLPPRVVIKSTTTMNVKVHHSALGGRLGVVGHGDHGPPQGGGRDPPQVLQTKENQAGRKAASHSKKPGNCFGFKSFSGLYGLTSPQPPHTSHTPHSPPPDLPGSEKKVQRAKDSVSGHLGSDPSSVSFSPCDGGITHLLASLSSFPH